MRSCAQQHDRGKSLSKIKHHDFNEPIRIGTGADDINSAIMFHKLQLVLFPGEWNAYF